MRVSNLNDRFVILITCLHNFTIFNSFSFFFLVRKEKDFFVKLLNLKSESISRDYILKLGLG